MCTAGHPTSLQFNFAFFVNKFTLQILWDAGCFCYPIFIYKCLSSVVKNSASTIIVYICSVSLRTMHYSYYLTWYQSIGNSELMRWGAVDHGNSWKHNPMLWDLAISYLLV